MADYSVCKLDEIEGSYGGGYKGLREPLSATAFGIGVIQMPADYADYPDHDHSDDGQEEVYMTLDGSGEMDIEGERVPLEPGVCVRVGASTKRKVIAGPNGIRFVAVGAPEGSYKSS
jgi:mannose-6-phosphate isomerase-like protein (cupin superfamily)